MDFETLMKLDGNDGSLLFRTLIRESAKEIGKKSDPSDETEDSLLGNELMKALELVSKDERLKDDSLEIEKQKKQEQSGNLLNKLKYQKLNSILKEKENDEVDLSWIFEDFRIEDESKDLLERSFIIPEAEINLRFDDPFTARSYWSVQETTLINKV